MMRGKILLALAISAAVCFGLNAQARERPVFCDPPSITVVPRGTIVGGNSAMDRGAAGVPAGSVRNARHCRRPRCRVNGRLARRFPARGAGDRPSSFKQRLTALVVARQTQPANPIRRARDEQASSRGPRKEIAQLQQTFALLAVRRKFLEFYCDLFFPCPPAVRAREGPMLCSEAVGVTGHGTWENLSRNASHSLHRLRNA